MSYYNFTCFIFVNKHNNDYQINAAKPDISTLEIFDIKSNYSCIFPTLYTEINSCVSKYMTE